MARRAARVDTNQAEIVAGLRALGFNVAHTHTVGQGFPDIVVGGNTWYGDSRLRLVEIKSRGGKLTPKEEQFIEQWGEFAVIAYGIIDVLRAFDWPETELSYLAEQWGE